MNDTLTEHLGMIKHTESEGGTCLSNRIDFFSLLVLWMPWSCGLVAFPSTSNIKPLESSHGLQSADYPVSLSRRK